MRMGSRCAVRRGQLAVGPRMTCMRKCLGAFVVLALLFGSAPRALAQAATAFCEAVHADADAARALLWSPELVLRGGWVGAFGGLSDVAAQGTSAKPRPQLLAGLRYRLGDLQRQALVRERAAASCARERAALAIAAVSNDGQRFGITEAFEAKRQALKALVKEAETQLAELKRLRDAQELVDAQLLDGELALRSLRRALREAEWGLVQAAPTLDLVALKEALGRWQDAEVAVHASEQALARADSWEAEIVGGYNEVFDLAQTVPLTGELRVRFDLGRLFQRRYQTRSLRALRRFRSLDPRQPVARAQEIVDTLREELDLERRALVDVRQLLEALGERRAIPAQDLGRPYAIRLWFQEAPLRADEAFHATRTRQLEAALQRVGATVAPEREADAAAP